MTAEAPLIAVLERHTDLRLVHSGQNHAYEPGQILFEEPGIRRARTT